jgi:hypothetical protein
VDEDPYFTLPFVNVHADPGTVAVFDISTANAIRGAAKARTDALHVSARIAVLSFMWMLSFS